MVGLRFGVAHYVCDRCGRYWTSMYQPTSCRCGHKAIWKFTRTIAALEHAAHIKERRAHQLEESA